MQWYPSLEIVIISSVAHCALVLSAHLPLVLRMHSLLCGNVLQSNKMIYLRQEGNNIQVKYMSCISFISKNTAMCDFSVVGSHQTFLMKQRKCYKNGNVFMMQSQTKKTKPKTKHENKVVFYKMLFQRNNQTNGSHN